MRKGTKGTKRGRAFLAACPRISPACPSLVVFERIRGDAVSFTVFNDEHLERREYESKKPN